MNYMFRVFLIYIFFLVFFVTSAPSQVNKTNNLFVCKEVESKVSGVLNIAKVTRRVSNEDECNFEFEVNREWILIAIKKYENRNESINAFSKDFDFLTLAETYPENVQNLVSDSFWDEAKGYFDTSDSDTLILLRYKKINLTLISSNYKLILKIESSLRDINFDIY